MGASLTWRRERGRAAFRFCSTATIWFLMSRARTCWLIPWASINRSEAVWDYWFAYTGRIGATLRLCDSFVTTNGYLADRALEYEPRLRVAIVPNYLNPLQQDLSQSCYRAKEESGWARDGRIHVGYFSGTPSHARPVTRFPESSALCALDPGAVIEPVGGSSSPGR